MLINQNNLIKKNRKIQLHKSIEKLKPCELASVVAAFSSAAAEVETFLLFF